MFWCIIEGGERLDQVSTMANPQTAWRKLRIIPRESTELLSELTVTFIWMTSEVMTGTFGDPEPSAQWRPSSCFHLSICKITVLFSLGARATCKGSNIQPVAQEGWFGAGLDGSQTRKRVCAGFILQQRAVPHKITIKENPAPLSITTNFL